MVDTRYGILDYIQLSLWYISFYVSCKWYGWLGAVAYLAGLLVLHQILYSCFGLESMSGGDSIFFLDDKRSCANIISSLKIEKIKFEELRDTLFDRSFMFPRTRSKVQLVLGRWFFKEMTEEYIRKNFDRCFKHVTDVHTQQELADFMAKEQSIREPLDFVQWKMYIIPDYSETESVFVFKCHHSLADGVALVMLTYNLTDKQRLEDIPRVTAKTGFFLKLLIWILLPILVLYYTIESQLLLPIQRNGIIKKHGGNLTNLKKGCISQDIPLDQLKAAAKKHKVSINDILMTAISNVFHKYLVKLGDRETTHINLAVPFSLRNEIKEAKDFTFNNEFAIMPISLRLADDYENNMKLIKKDMDKVKVSTAPFGYYYTIMALMLMPYIVSQTLLEVFSSKCTFVFSNVPGPRNPYVIAGKKVKNMNFYVPQMLKVPGGISIISHYDCVNLGLLMDQAVVDHPQELMDMFYEKFDQIFGSKEWRKFKGGQ